MRMAAWMVVAAAAGVVLTAARAVEIHSNGAGGGLWSDPGSWHGRVLPGAPDVVTIAGDDDIIVDLVDTNRISCQELNLDPRGVLSFQKGGARTVLIVNGPIESYGAIRMDMSRREDGSAELRLVSTNAPGREIRLRRGGSILANGRRDLPDGERNAWLVVAPPGAGGAGVLQVNDNTALDLNGAGVRNLQITAYAIDNTGTSPVERFNVAGCRFTGQSAILLSFCDSAVIAENEFIDGAGYAVRFENSTMGEVRGNTVRGNYSAALTMAAHNEGTMVDNTVEAFAGTALYYAGGNAMLKNNTVRNSPTAFFLGGYGLAENCVASNCPNTVTVSAGSSFQLTGLRSLNPPSNAVPVLLDNGDATLLNCAVTTNQIKCLNQPHTNWWVQTQQYLVVKVNGSVPANSRVSVRTAVPTKPLPPGATDFNVRNSPAPIVEGGWTPLPQSLAALIVNSWSLGADGKYQPPPAYVLQVLGPAPAAGQPPPVLKEMTVTPTEAWYRSEPNERKATVEVSVP